MFATRDLEADELMSMSMRLLTTLASLTQVRALRNVALVFIKPHAATDATEAFVRGHLQSAGISIVDSGVKTAAEIEKQRLIDQHYGSLAQLAMDAKPSELAVSPEALSDFESTYGLPWSEVVAGSSALTNPEAMKALKVDGSELERLWRGGVQLKLAPGTYVSRLDRPGKDDMYTLNGFYPAMRQACVEDGASVRYMVCEWEQEKLTWKAFRQEVIGATNPADAAGGSCRAELLKRWQELGLAEEPSMKLNGVHASAGPLEGLKERCVWCGATLSTDEFAKRIMDEAGLSEGTLTSWLADNPPVTLGGDTDKVFDLTEEMGCDEVLQLCKAAGGGRAGGGAYEYAAAQEIY